MRNKLILLAVFVISFSYYTALSSKIYTWVLGSGDSGGWLASALTWYPPQPFGNPLYVLLGHGLAALPGDLVIKYTIVGSCFASAVTVSLVYLIVYETTKSVKIGLLSTGVLLASVVFLSQSTTLSQYPLAVMWVVLAFWFYLQDRRKLVVIALGLGTAMHFVVGVTALLWITLEWRQGGLRQWVRLVPLYLAVGALPYTLTLWELWMLNKVLNLQALLGFVNNTSGAGGLSIVQLPERLLDYTAWLTVSLGAALVPIVYGLRQSTVKGYLLLLAPIMFVSWYYLTAQDPTVWHYLPWVMPFLAIFAGVGLDRMRDWVPAKYVTVIGITALLVVNAALFNADSIAHQYPAAGTLCNNIRALPQGSIVACERFGAGTTLRYIIATDRPDIQRIPPADAPAMAQSHDVYVIDLTTLEVSKWQGR